MLPIRPQFALATGVSLFILSVASPAAGQTVPAPSPTPPADNDSAAIVVTGHRLDLARDQIQASLGASDTKITAASINAQPGGSARTLSSVLLQAPGVAADGDDDIHIRNEHGNVQYRLDGIIVPQGVGAFGQTFDTRIAKSVDLLTGTLPAQYGYRTAGVVNLTTGGGQFEDDGDIGIYAGAHDRIEPSARIVGNSGSVSYFASASYRHDTLGIDNPTPGYSAIHDRTDQYRAFAYVADVLSDHSRVALFGGTAIGDFQIPNIPSLTPQYTVNGQSGALSSQLDQNQHEETHYAVASYQYSGDALDVVVAPFVRYSLTHFRPDPQLRDIQFNGFADDTHLSSLATGIQADGSDKLTPTHTLRFGLFFQNELTRSILNSMALPVDANGVPTSDRPLAISDRGGITGQLYGAYVQDEWKLTPELTLNYGARFDVVDAYTRENQLSPRINLVYKSDHGLTLHAGFARNFTPPPQELIGTPTLALYQGTAEAANSLTSGSVKAERESYYDAGVQQRLGHLTLALDSYYKVKTNLIDEGQFGASLVQSPFNYAKGYAWGVEASAVYDTGPFEIYANLARGREKGTNIVSSQYFFAPAELAYIQNHYIFTDHSQEWTGSGGASYRLHDGIGTLTPAIDFTYGDGLRAADPNGIVPNGGKLPSYFVVNAALAQSFGSTKEPLTVRVDIENLLDHAYVLRDGSGVGVGAPQYGARRAIYVELTKSF